MHHSHVQARMNPGKRLFGGGRNERWPRVSWPEKVGRLALAEGVREMDPDAAFWEEWDFQERDALQADFRTGWEDWYSYESLPHSPLAVKIPLEGIR